MGSQRAAEERLTPDAAEFVRFCHRRRAVGWPELYDEMCLVASRGLFRGWGPSDLAEHGIGFGLFELPSLAALTSQVVAEERAARRPVVSGASLRAVPTAERRATSAARSDGEPTPAADPSSSRAAPSTRAVAPQLARAG